MKRFFLSIAMALLVLGCGSDNAYDGETGLIGSASAGGETATFLKQINNNVLIKNSVLQVQRADVAKNAIAELSQEQSSANLQAAQQQATLFFNTWKRVEALYVAKKYNDTMIDHPSQIDYFNIGKGSLTSKLDNIYASKFALQDLLFQSSTRSTTALEYTLFGNQEGLDVNMTQRRADAAMVMIEYLIEKSDVIAEFYKSSSAFVNSSEESVGIMINQLIDSTYKLKEWRIGDAAGYTQNYKDKPDASRYEYYKSFNTRASIVEILSAQLEMMQEGLESIASQNAAANEAKAIIDLIKDAINQINNMSGLLESNPVTDETKTLYATVNALQNSYSSLISALNFQQDIIEADGD
ncbi:MAG: imelysin family protein [Campylobacterota bacterium]|nr:imelysin family protein [Campylobacterota bacterium]